MAFTNITVAGGGVLGSQIAFQTAYRGFDVTMWLRSEASIERARLKLERLRDIYTDTLKRMGDDTGAWCRGLAQSPDIGQEELDRLIGLAEGALERIHLTCDLDEAARSCDLLIECIAENPQEKIDFYTALAPHLSERAIVATNSSTMLPSTFAPYTGRPERYLALHFANEIWRNNTAEVMGHPGTDPAVFDQVVAFARDIQMIPLELHREQPGYILNSLLVPFLSAAEALLATGVADVETIDKTWVLATGAPMGPFRILDIVGLTTAYNIGSLDPRAADPSTVQGKVAALLKGYIDAGKTGVAAGEGFYTYR